MRLTKDEARILAGALSEQKYYLIQHIRSTTLLRKLEKLEAKLEYFGKDKRRIGRTSQDDWSDVLKRYENKN